MNTVRPKTECDARRYHARKTRVGTDSNLIRSRSCSIAHDPDGFTAC